MRLLIVGFILAVTSTAMAGAPPPPPVAMPDAGSSAMMLGLSFAGLAAGARLFRRK